MNDTPRDNPPSNIRTAQLRIDPRSYQRGLSCVHCGLCLPACPTYTQNGNEADSPRGRIQLMLGLADGAIAPTPEAREHLDLCLDCRACETACPAGVVYHELLEDTRVALRKYDREGTSSGMKRPFSTRFIEWMFLNVLTHPTRLKLSLFPARVLQKIGLYHLLRKSGIFNVLPPGLRKMEQMLPPTGALWPSSLQQTIAPRGQRKARVVFLQGCVGSVMFDKVNQMAVELLSAAGAEVIVPPALGCCGAMHHHSGVIEPAMDMAKRNIAAAESAWEATEKIGDCPLFFTTTIAGCGSMVREYDHLLRDDAQFAQRAKMFSGKVRDISELLYELGLPDMPHQVILAATYHDACHLIHAQKVASAPRALLSKVKGLNLVPLYETDMCCGAAGTYNLTQPAMATDLAERKVRNIDATKCELCITGNVGCAMHIQSHAAASGRAIRVVHPIEILHRAVFGDAT